MSAVTLRGAIPTGSLLVLDSSVVLSYLNGTDAVAPAATIVMDDLVAPGLNHAAISTITVMEALVRPIQSGSSLVAMVETFLRHFANLAIVAVDYDIARAAADVRARTGLKAPDAIVIATALVGGGVLIANDGRWQSAVTKLGHGLRLIHLDRFLPI